MKNSLYLRSFRTLTLAVLGLYVVVQSHSALAYDPVTSVKNSLGKMKVGPKDWPQWGGTPDRNNTPVDAKIPASWDVKQGTNILWSAALGSESYGNPVVANGKVYVGTNNGKGYLTRYPSNIDLGVLVCFDEKDGKFLWQHSSEKLATGRVNDWPDQGICCAPMIDGERGWFVTSRGEVVCFDTEGFRDKENDGPFKQEAFENDEEADVIWKLDMMKDLKVFQHNMCSCSVTSAGDFLFVNTSNGVDEGHIAIPEEKSPSFICLNRDTGAVLWTDNSPGSNILHGQWSSPAYGVFGGQAQVLFGGGDGWLYSFDPAGDNGKSKLLWKFDCNPKNSFYTLIGATRNHLIATPVVYDGLVYIAVGEDPEHGEGHGHLWCIDPTKRGDVSPTIVYNSANPQVPIAHKRLQALVEKDGDLERDNPNSAAVWHYVGNNPKDFEQAMHRTCGTASIKNDMLVLADFAGLVHCLDVKTGNAFWTYDMLAASWASALIVGDLIYVSDEDGDISIFKLAKEFEMVGEINMGSSVYTTPIVANDTLFIANRNRIYAIKEGATSAPEKE
ncbi:MAG: PQQ-binding-like beta-propeller repeat protein [Pirellulaceae bacterium]|nr:PQQ-binding-like beta-propeller repeat protein [Pirellulaceae bacterium]